MIHGVDLCNTSSFIMSLTPCFNSIIYLHLYTQGVISSSVSSFSEQAEGVIISYEEEKNAPTLVTCDQEVYALCAYANCTLNEKTKTANCPCYSLSGPSMVRIDIIPDAEVKQDTLDKCNEDACDQNNAPVCNAISDGTLWPGSDAVSTFSHELEEENGVEFDDNGEKITTWNCTTSPQEVRFVPNCMLAPCRFLDTPITNDYFAGSATMECTCALIQATTPNYGIVGGLNDPCGPPPSYVNTGGSSLNAYAANEEAVKLAWKEVTREFGGDVSSSSAWL